MEKIITDNKWKNFKYGNEVPKSVLKDQFLHLSDSENVDELEWMDGFINYRKNWYHTSDFMVTEAGGELAKKGFNGIHGDSFFSGVAIQIADDGEQYKIALVLS